MEILREPVDDTVNFTIYLDVHDLDLLIEATKEGSSTRGIAGIHGPSKSVFLIYPADKLSVPDVIAKG